MEPTESHLPGLAWYVVHTRSRHEATVETALRLKGLETFLPRIKTPSRRRDRKVILDLPLFPGYLFIQSDLEPASYLNIIRLRGVVRVLGNKRSFTPVSLETLESIRSMIDSGRPYYRHPFLKRGTNVRIIEGPLAGISGIILEEKEKKRKLVVSVELFRRSVAVELENDAVEPYR